MVKTRRNWEKTFLCKATKKENPFCHSFVKLFPHSSFGDFPILGLKESERKRGREEEKERERERERELKNPLLIRFDGFRCSVDPFWNVVGGSWQK